MRTKPTLKTRVGFVLPLTHHRAAQEAAPGALWRAESAVDDLRDLSPRCRVTGSESAITVPRYDAMVERRLHERIKRVARRNIREMRPSARVNRPPFRTHHDLAQLPARDVIAPPEGTIA